MVDVVYDWISTHVDMFIIATFISFMSLGIAQTHALSNQVSLQQQNAEVLSSYREYNQFNNKDVLLADYQASLLSLIGKTRIVINDLNAGRRYDLDWSSYQAPDEAFRYDLLDSQVTISAKLLNYTPNNLPIEEWTGGDVGGVYFTIKNK